MRAEAEGLRRAAAHAPPVIHELSQGHVHGGGGRGAAGGGGGVLVPRGDLAELERQLRDKAAQVRRQERRGGAGATAPPVPSSSSSAQVSLLKARHDHLEAKAAAERELYDRAIAALDQQNAALRDTRAALQVRPARTPLPPRARKRPYPSPSSSNATLLQAAETDVDLLRGRAAAATQLEGELRTAREEARRLEVRAD